MHGPGGNIHELGIFSPQAIHTVQVVYLEGNIHEPAIILDHEGSVHGLSSCEVIGFMISLGGHALRRERLTATVIYKTKNDGPLVQRTGCGNICQLPKTSGMLGSPLASMNPSFSTRLPSVDFVYTNMQYDRQHSLSKTTCRVSCQLATPSPAFFGGVSRCA